MSTVDEVKARLDIVEVVGGYVRLQKAGRYFKAVCPFHTEKTPSFVVYPERQSWHCFGACGTGGDVISFISKKENLDFGGALRLLADRAGVEVSFGGGPRREEAKSLQDANEAAAIYFHSLLQTSKTARAYAEERGLDAAAIADFQIGLAPSGWDGLRNHLTSRGYTDRQLIDAGLVIESDRGGYDRFRDRLMFPIRDDRGRVAGFGGRSLPGSESERNSPSPKYINTPQTPIFDKGGILYGLDRAREEVRLSHTAVIVEGYMDVIAAHQHGFRNVVASMGTALTEKQAGLVRRFATRVVLAMDADEAGSAANLRAVQVVAAAAERPARGGASVGTDGRGRSERLEIRVLALPSGKDPDELIRQDAAAWTTAVESAEPVIDHYYKVCRGGRDLNDPRERQALIDEMLPVVAELRSPVEQAGWVQRIAGGRAREDDLWRQIRSFRRNAATAATRRKEGDETPSAAVEPKTFAAKSKRAPREEFILALLYRLPDLRRGALEMGDELGQLLTLSENRELWRRWCRDESVSEEEAELWEHYQTVLQIDIGAAETGGPEEAFLSCVRLLESVRMRAVKEASALALAEGTAGLRPGQVASIARAKLGTGREDETEVDEPTEAGADLFVEDHKNNLLLFRPVIERSRSEQLADGGPDRQP